MPFIPDPTQAAPQAQPQIQAQPAQTAQPTQPDNSAPPATAQFPDPNQQPSNVGQFVNQQAQGFQQAGQQEAQMGLNPLARLGNFATDAVTGLGNIVSGIGKMVYAPLSALNPGDTRSMEEKSRGGIEGLNQAIGGAFQTAASPLSISPLLKKTVSTPFEALSAGVTGLVKSVGVDPSTQAGQDIVNSINSAAGMTMAGLEINKGWNAQSDAAGTARWYEPDATAAKARVADAFNSLAKDVHGTIQDAMPESLSNKLINVNALEKTLSTQSLQKIMNEKVDMPQWNETFDTQLGKVTDLIKDKAQMGQISIGDMHSILSDLQQVSPKDVTNPYLGEINGKITQYLVGEADKQTSGILGKFYNDIGQKTPGLQGATAGQSGTPPVGEVPPTGAPGGESVPPVGEAPPSTAPQTPPGPVLPPEVAGKDIGNTMASVGSAFTGLEPSVIQQIAKDPAMQAWIEKQGIDVTRGTVFDNVKTGLDKKIADLKSTGSVYDSIRKDTTPVNMSTVDGNSVLQKYIKDQGLSIDKNGKITGSDTSAVRLPEDLREVQKLYDIYQNKPVVSPQVFLNMRDDVDSMKDWANAQSSDAVDKFAGGLRTKLNDVGRSQINGLKAIDDKYSGLLDETRGIRNMIYDGSGNIKDSAISQVNNLLRKGNETKLGRIEELAPGTTRILKGLKAAQDVENAAGNKVGTYSRSLAGAATGALVGGGLGSLVGIGLESYFMNPERISKMLQAYGTFKGPEIDTIMSKVQSGIRFTKPEAAKFSQAAIKAGLFNPPQLSNSAPQNQQDSQQNTNGASMSQNEGN